MASTVRGVIHGKMIELEVDPGIEAGRGIQVTIRTEPSRDAQRAAILRTAGAMADDPEFAAIMDQIERERHSEPDRGAAG